MLSPHRILPLAYIPLFVGIPGMSLPILYLFGISTSRDSANIAASILISCVGFYIWWRGSVRRYLSRHIWICIIWLSLSLLSGMMFGEEEPGAAFYVQTLLPLFAAPFGLQLARNPESIGRFVNITSATGGVVVASLILLIVLHFGPRVLMYDRMFAMKEIAYAIPQFKSYYPITVLASFSFTLSKYIFSKQPSTLDSIWLALHVAFLPLCWSRAGMVGFVLCALIQATLVLYHGDRLSRQRTMLAAIVCGVALPLAASHLGSTYSARTEVHSVDNDSDHNRLEYFLEGCRRVAASPLFGDMFIPSLDKDFMGEEANTRRLFPAHNQYVDLMLRGGVVYLLLFLSMTRHVASALLYTGGTSAFRRDRRYLVAVAGSLGFLIPTLITANFQLYFIQLQTAVPFYMVVGLCSGLAESARAQERCGSSTRRPVQRTMTALNETRPPRRVAA